MGSDGELEIVLVPDVEEVELGVGGVVVVLVPFGGEVVRAGGGGIVVVLVPGAGLVE